MITVAGATAATLAANGIDKLWDVEFLRFDDAIVNVKTGEVIRFDDNTAPALGAPLNVIAAAGAEAFALRIPEPTDADGDALTVTIGAVPGYGEVRVGSAAGALVTMGTVLTAAELASLVYVPSADGDHAGGALAYSVFDGTDTVDASVAIDVAAASTSPALVFRAVVPGLGVELAALREDGSHELVANIHPTPNFGSNAIGLTLFNDEVYFRADNGLSGFELWKLDASGNVAQVADIAPGPSSSVTFFTEEEIIVFNGALYFNADDGSGRVLWKMDADGNVGQVANMQVFAFEVFNGELYFQASDGVTGFELWKLDADDTIVQVADIFAGFGSSAPNGFKEFDGELYFNASGDSGGRELWKLDVLGNVVFVADINPGFASANPYGFTEFNGELYFTADHATSGREIWKLDSLGNIAQVTDVNVGVGSSFLPPQTLAPPDLKEFDGELFFGADDGTSGFELWKLDALGNVSQVADLNPFGSSFPAEFIEFDEKLYFRANDGASGAELWSLDTDGNLTLAADIVPGFGSSSPASFVEFALEDGGTVLTGTPDADLLVGGSGDDTLIGGMGDDILIGQAGADRFVRQALGEGVDMLPEFTPGEDTFVFDADAFGGGLVAGPLAFDRLVTAPGPVADQAHGQFLYDTATGALSWDAGGTAGDDPVQIAVLPHAPLVSATDFLLA
jgi:ELWxxDGT repeat protein